MSQSSPFTGVSVMLKPSNVFQSRSEEHTSELQSRSDIVCRLLLEKKKYRNYVRSNALLRAGVSQVTGALPEGPVEVVSLGAGQGTKDFHLLTELAAGGRAVAYVPVDAGQTLLEMACAGAAERGLICRGIKADLTNPAHLSGLVPGRETPCRFVLLLGHTLGGRETPYTLRPLP